VSNSRITAAAFFCLAFERRKKIVGNKVDLD